MFRSYSKINTVNGKRSVLIVEDEQINREMLGFILSDAYDVLYASNGQEALKIMRQNAPLLSLVLLDVLMPVMDGFEVLKVMRDDENLRRIPVIVLTTEKSYEVKCLRLGASDFIKKPYDEPEVVLARVARIIELSETTHIIQSTEFDQLTGLVQQEYFYQYAKQFDIHHPDSPTDAVLLDIVNFHLVNALCGHEAGNRLLIRIAEELRRFVRENNGIVCRRSADMFMLYVTHRDSYEDLPERLQSVLEMPEMHTRIRIRMGVYPNTQREDDIRIRFDRAKIARDSIKGVATIGIYDAGLQEKQLLHHRLIDEMDRALAEKQFKVYYQPKYRVGHGEPKLSSAEALIRWIHPELGFISPGEFIPLFEENALITKLDRYVWRRAAEQIRAWKEAFGIILPVSVNVSRIDLYDPDLIPFLETIVRENGLENKDLLLEITETAYAADAEQVIGVITDLRGRGFRIEMDDFGSGYSSLNMLAEMPIDVLKLDMKFVRSIGKNEKSIQILKLMMDIKNHFAIPAVAEGVETEEQLRLLTDIGCDLIQGYYFSPPVPPEKFNALLEKQRGAV